VDTTRRPKLSDAELLTLAVAQVLLGVRSTPDRLRRSLHRPDRTAIDRDQARVEVLGIWWEDGFAPSRADGFVDAMREALRAYLRFARADRLDWAPHLAAEKRLFLTGL
jgi:hypothetical protein